MRIDKFTSKFQQALSDAQSLAVGRDHSLIEPAHLLLALIDQQGGNSLPVLRQAGVNLPVLKQKLNEALEQLPKVAGQDGQVIDADREVALVAAADQQVLSTE